MNDKQFQALLNKLAKANERYKDLLKLAENEIERRYGVDPASVDNDSWIDVFHTGVGSMTVKQVDESMKLHMNL